jgi:hypothetical protein
MEPVTSVALQQFLQKLGEQFTQPAKLYLLGGSALCLLGSPRETLDVDYSLEPHSPEFKNILRQISSELRLDLESVSLADFIPLPPNSEKRHRFLGRHGQVDVYIYDLYSIALSKIARGFESDLEDVEFLLLQKLIEWDELEAHFKSILPHANKADIDPKEFETYFNTLKKQMGR